MSISALRQTPLCCNGHTRPVVDLAFSDITQHGTFLISACKDGKPMLRQGDTGDWIGTFEGHKGAVWGATLNKDARRAATGSADFTAKVWDAVSGEELQCLLHTHIVKSVNFSDDSRWLLTAGHDPPKIFDLNSPTTEVKTFKGHAKPVKTAKFIAQDKQIVTASDDKTVRVWDVASGDEIQKLDFPQAPGSCEVSSDGTIMTIAYGNFTSFWDARRYKKIKEYELPAPINSASLHPNRHMFVAGGEDFIMYKYDYETGEELESCKGHFGPIHCVSFSPDGEVYASGSEDGTLRLWQTVVGKTYGLWKCVQPGENGNGEEISQIKAET